MKVGLIADVHSNLHALLPVQAKLAGMGVEKTICAGDIVGYGADPDRCCREIRNASVISIAGNHDRATTTGDFTRMNPYAAAAASWTRDRIDEESMTFLESLPIQNDVALGNDVAAAVFHGSDLDPDEYVYEEDVNEGVLERSRRDVVVLGHTHMPFVVHLPAGIVVNPGSVGQPRDGDPRASFAVFDTASMACEIHRVTYDVDTAAEAILGAGLPATLASRLYAGR